MDKETLQMTMLFDFFGELLTEKQRRYFDLYYNEDLSLSEIAENEGISRQGVRDIIVRAESILVKMEAKTGVIRKYAEGQKDIALIEGYAEEILVLNNARFKNGRLHELTNNIIDRVQYLKG